MTGALFAVLCCEGLGCGEPGGPLQDGSVHVDQTDRRTEPAAEDQEEESR